MHSSIDRLGFIFLKKSTKVCIINVDIIDMVISTIIVNTMYILFLIILYKFTYGSNTNCILLLHTIRGFCISSYKN